MFTIADGRDRLYQWDVNVKLALDDPSSTICGAHFKARFSRDSIFVPVIRTDDGAYVTVPNILLQKSYDLVVYAYCDVDLCTKDVDVFTVEAKPRPADYVYTETEVLTYLTLDKRLSDLERFGGATEEQIATALAEYLKKNPVQAGSSIFYSSLSFEYNAGSMLSLFNCDKLAIRRNGREVQVGDLIIFGNLSLGIVEKVTDIYVSGALYASLKGESGSGGGLIVTDDDNGNVSIKSVGSVTITDDGLGNVVIV